jgi:hypothetical protein
MRGAGEGIRTPASTKPTGWLAHLARPFCANLDLEASALTTPPPRLDNKDCGFGLKTFQFPKAQEAVQCRISLYLFSWDSWFEETIKWAAKLIVIRCEPSFLFQENNQRLKLIFESKPDMIFLRKIMLKLLFP